MRVSNITHSVYIFNETGKSLSLHNTLVPFTRSPVGPSVNEIRFDPTQEFDKGSETKT